MLEGLGLEFKIVASKIDEEIIKKKYLYRSPEILAKKLAKEKAKKISQLYQNAFVIGADQICIHNKKIINKPMTKKKAFDQLKILNGKKHFQISAFCLYHNKVMKSVKYDIACLKMRKLKSQNIKDYILLDMPLSSCGSYKIESRGKLLFSKIEGSMDTVMGLPLLLLLNDLLKHKVISYA